MTTLHNCSDKLLKLTCLKVFQNDFNQMFLSASLAPKGLPEGEDEDGEQRSMSSNAATSPHTTMSPQSIMSPHTTSSPHTTTSPHSTMSPHTTTSPHTTMSPYTTTSSRVNKSPYATTQHRDRDTQGQASRSDKQEFLDIQASWFDKLKLDLVEMRLSFERSLRQMESRTHSLLWSMSRRMERMTEAMDHNSAPSHQTKTYLSLSRSLSSDVAAMNHRPKSPHTRGQRTHGSRRGSRA